MNTLLMTATFDCGNCSTQPLKDENKRKLDYEKALENFLYSSDLHIVFVENSKADLSFLKEKFSNFSERIEFISFDGNQNVDLYGKGHGEKNAIVYGVKNSKKLKNKNHFYKISGRYFSRDIENIIKYSTEKFDSEEIYSVNRFREFNGNTKTVFFGANKDLFLSKFTDELVISDGATLFETAYSQMLSQIDEGKVFYLDAILYEDSIASNGEIITLH
jgi:hypothetical protein